MRMIATFRYGDKHAEPGPEATAEALDLICDVLANRRLLPVDDAKDRSDVLAQLVTDMSDVDKRRFESTWRVLVRDPLRGTVGSVSVLPRGILLVRLRNATLQRLVPVGHEVVENVMHAHGPGKTGSGVFSLTGCEVRERGTSEAFLHGSWRGGERSYFRYLFAQKRALFIAGLFVFGLALEVALTFAPNQQLPIVQLGLRLGAPMLVSSLVLLLERMAQWRDQRQPSLVWSTSESVNSVDPFHMPNPD